MRLRAGIAALVMLASVPLAAAQPRIPANELPGRERERFFDTPALQRQRDRSPGLFPVAPSDAQPAQRRKCRGKGARGRQKC